MAIALQLLMHSDNDQFYVCVVGVPHLDTDKTLLIVFSSSVAQRCMVFQLKWKSGKFFEEISSSVLIMSPNHTETTSYSPLDR